MSHYSIKDLETLSGVKAHTIRIWEKRYDLLHPTRTDTNIRTYSDDDVKTLLNVALLNRHGFKISRIADMSAIEICDRIENLTNLNSDLKAIVDLLIVDMIDMREERLTDRVNSLVAHHGIIESFAKVFYPFLERIGILWQIGSITPSQEHFVSHLLRNRLIAEIVALDNNWDSEERFVLFLPQNELHEIALLLYYYILKSKGVYVVYLGQNVPYSDLQQVIGNSNATHTLSVHINAVEEAELNNLICNLSNDFPDQTHYATGFQAINLVKAPPSNVVIVKSIDAFLA